MLLWAHSDQKGGTEIPCLLAESLQARAANVKLAIVTPYPDFVKAFFSHLRVDTIQTPRLLELNKYRDGSVDPDATAKLVRERFEPGLPEGMKGVVGHCQYTVREYMKQAMADFRRTLIVSCGEPVALAVARGLSCRGIIISDHLLTLSVREVLENAGLLDGAAAEVMTELVPCPVSSNPLGYARRTLPV